MKILLLLVIIFICPRLYAENNNVKYLENGKMVVGVLPGIGGRIVYFGTKEGGNILKSAPGLWNDSENEKPKISEINDYKAYHGNIIWPSPMSEWWSKQNLYPVKKKNGERWPPDPYLIYGAYKILSQSDSSIKWQSPESPVSGIQITQSVVLKENAEMIFEVDFKNISDSVIHWGIWFNTRLEGRANCFVKVSSEDKFYVKDEEKLKTVFPWNYEDDFFTFMPEKVINPSEKIYSKVCINSESDWIAAFSDSQMILIKTPGIDKLRIHPDHQFSEIFNQVTPDKKDDLLELEFHTEYRKIEPGGKISARQIWRIFNTGKLDNNKERISFLTSNILQ